MSQSKGKLFPFPTAFELAALLSLVVLVLAASFTPTQLTEAVVIWGHGLWGLLAFMAQMALILLFGYTLAKAPRMEKFLFRLALWPKSAWGALFLTFSVSVVACYLNWGMGLVASALFCQATLRAHPGLPRSLLISSSYMGFLFWHGGLSGSIPLTVSTPGNFSESLIGGTLALDKTLFSDLNFSLLAVCFIALSGTLWWRLRQLQPRADLDQREKASLPRGPHVSASAFPVGPLVKKDLDKDGLSQVPTESAQQITRQSFLARLSFWILVLMLIGFVGIWLGRGDFQLHLNSMIFLVFLVGLLLHGGLEEFSRSAAEGAAIVAPILVQYPLYAAIMAVMTETGLAEKIASLFIATSSPQSLPLLSFWSAGLINVFIPSGGGQWAVQGPIVLASAQQLSVPIEKVVLAVAWGDAWTNLVQPFWALPLLTLSGGKLSELWRDCLAALVMSGLVLSICFYFF